MNTTTDIFPNYTPNILGAEVMTTNITNNVVPSIQQQVFFIMHDAPEKKSKAQDFLAKIKNKYQDIAEESELFKNLDKYNLVDIFDEVHENPYYISNNKSQLELIEKFQIESFEMLYLIMQTIGISHNLDWKYIQMPVEKFSLLVQYIEYYHTQYFTQEDYLLIAQDLEYHNLSALYGALDALGFSDGIQKINFHYRDVIDTLMFTHKYVNSHIESTHDLEDIHMREIYMHYYDGVRIGKKRSYTEFKKLLSLFGYHVINS